ncbi:hypothetical protein BU14_0167s0016 [Porphyra umbilicalis]|uniref:Uncharacterized protein n=1 Tax=Porphyra umbilicalis TaxID=2786 RepID=A0A1X6P7W1_PORUM|nr:hypothetical protein BU14_0167s0016 [Porphyra umbilicalis]|eukprot:OSX76944.1 hypothetical protein BU14_0167s0016 [Porphyra umbilicalis]
MARRCSGSWSASWAAFLSLCARRRGTSRPACRVAAAAAVTVAVMAAVAVAAVAVAAVAGVAPPCFPTGAPSPPARKRTQTSSTARSPPRRSPPLSQSTGALRTCLWSRSSPSPSMPGRRPSPPPSRRRGCPSTRRCGPSCRARRWPPPTRRWRAGPSTRCLRAPCRARKRRPTTRRCCCRAGMCSPISRSTASAGRTSSSSARTARTSRPRPGVASSICEGRARCFLAGPCRRRCGWCGWMVYIRLDAGVDARGACSTSVGTSGGRFFVRHFLIRCPGFLVTYPRAAAVGCPPRRGHRDVCAAPRCAAASLNRLGTNFTAGGGRGVDRRPLAPLPR